MTEDERAFRLELHLANGGGVDYEAMGAASDEEAIELGQLRLLLGPDYGFVRVCRGEIEIAVFRRDSESRSILRQQ